MILERGCGARCQERPDFLGQWQSLGSGSRRGEAEGWQIAVLLRKFAVLLPGCSIGRFGYPSLAYGIEVRILLAQHLHPVCHRIAVGIRIGIHTDAVDTSTLYPPLTVLNQILDDVRIALVQIWHTWHKPAIYSLLP